MDNNLAVLIDFENIAAGTEKEGLGRFDVEALMARLKDKGRILIARSYADWGRFARFKQTLLMSNVTMMELTSHGMQDKNRADIAMVVDCLELAFTKNYIDTFVVVSGDSDFTPLVLKMRELNKRVIGCGTRSSTSRLLIQACDEFMFYDTIVKEARRPRPIEVSNKGPTPTTEESSFELLADALEGIQRENPEPCHASIVKTAVLRKSPDFDEVDQGFGSFARFLEAAAEAGYVRLSRDQKSGGYRVDSMDSRTGAVPAPDEEREDRDDRDDRDRNARDPWPDPYAPEGSAVYVEPLTAVGLNPLAYPTRLAVLQVIESTVAERRKKRRRITVPFVQDDVRKRLKKTHPDLPGRAVRAVFDALMQAGLLLHRDGRPIRAIGAPFILDRDAEKLNAVLVRLYIDALRTAGADLTHADTLAALFLGNPERKREIEEAIAWQSAEANSPADDDDDRPAPAHLVDDSGLDLDDLLQAEDDPFEVGEAPAPVPAPEPEPEAAAPEAEPDAEAEKPKRRRRTRTSVRRDETEAGGATPPDLDAVLAVDEPAD